MNIQWDAGKYTADFSFVHQYGSGVMDLIDAGAGAAVLDLGCGNGALTKVLKERGYAAKGLDASEEFLDIARETCPGIEFVRGDATHFSFPEPFDAVFSNAVFHWIEKARQPDMLGCVRAALKEGGQFVFEFGGHGNNRLIHGALAEAFAERGFRYEMPFYFPTIGEYAALLEGAGFSVRYAALFDRPTELKGEDGLKDWINMFVRTPFSAAGAGQEREAIIDRAAELLRGDLYADGRWHADYVRIRMKAVRL